VVAATSAGASGRDLDSEVAAEWLGRIDGVVPGYQRGRLVNHTLAVTRRAGYRGVDRKLETTCVHVFDRARLDLMLSPEAIEGYRRSAAMAPLAPAAVAEIIDTAAELARRQREIAKALHALHSRWPAVRGALNELSKLTGYD
jgi:hypothetical protein